MPPEVYESALAFLQRSGIPEARLLGGEPTEHPHFSQYLTLARQRGLKVLVFTGGLIPEPALEFMTSLPANALSVLLNVADPASDSEALVNRQRQICKALGSKVMLGVNILSSRQNPSHVFDWIDQYGLHRRIRVGITHPIWGGPNEFFRLRGPREVPLFEELVAAGATFGVTVGFDCGFTPCMFSRGFVRLHEELFRPGVKRPDTKIRPGACKSVEGGALGELHTTAGAPPLPTGITDVEQKETHAVLIEGIGVRCHPVVDILPEGDCIACYALSRFRRVRLSSTHVYTDVVSSLEEELVASLPHGVYPECTACGYHSEGICGGGCRARRAFRLRPNPLIPLGPRPEEAHA